MRRSDRLLFKIGGWTLIGFAPLGILIGVDLGVWWIGVPFGLVGVLILKAADLVGAGLPDHRPSATRRSRWLGSAAKSRINVAFWCATVVEIAAVIVFFVKAFDMPEADALPIYRLLFFPASLTTDHPGDGMIALLAINALLLTLTYAIVVEIPLALLARRASAKAG